METHFNQRQKEVTNLPGDDHKQSHVFPQLGVVQQSRKTTIGQLPSEMPQENIEYSPLVHFKNIKQNRSGEKPAAALHIATIASTNSAIWEDWPEP